MLLRCASILAQHIEINDLCQDRYRPSQRASPVTREKQAKRRPPGVKRSYPLTAAGPFAGQKSRAAGLSLDPPP